MSNRCWLLGSLTLFISACGTDQPSPNGQLEETVKQSSPDSKSSHQDNDYDDSSNYDEVSDYSRKQAKAPPANSNYSNCIKNETDKTYNLGISHKNLGTMVNRLSPGSVFCADVQGDPDVFVRLELNGSDHCKTRVKVGVSYSLTQFEKSGECTWEPDTQ